MGIKHNRLTEEMQKKLLSRIEKREWEDITPTEQLMEVRRLPTTRHLLVKKKRTEVSGSSGGGGSKRFNHKKDA